MKLDDAIEFLVAKCELMADLAEAESVREHARQVRGLLDAACRNPRLSMARLRSIDREGLERALEGPDAVTVSAAIRRRLVERFGVSRLGPTDRAVMRRVLRRGEVANSEEYYQLKDLVEMGPEDTGLTAEKFEELETIVESFVDPGEALAEVEPIPEETDGKKSRRVPPPPFDLTLEADEVLCPPEISTEKRVEFIRAKYAKVMACPMRPECRAMLANHQKWGLEFARQEIAVWERPGERLEHCEHEAEYFPGYEVSGRQHRAIERELEVEFGFRRLGPSAQARLARMFANGDAGTRRNRDIIERFIKQYPHQTLFTRAELKRVPELLRQPAPGMGGGKPAIPSRPVTASKLPLLCPGAVFRVKFSERLVRVLASDEIEVFYDCDWGESIGWGLQDAGHNIFFYRHAALWFLDGAERLRVDSLPADVLSAARPDLPLRFGRSSRLAWRKGGFATKAALEDHVRSHDPSLLSEAPLSAARVKIYPYSARGAMKPSVLVNAPDGTACPFLDLLWHAYRHQVPFSDPTCTGIGFFRVGFERDGTPSYYLGGYDDRGGATLWHREALPAP